MKGFDSGENNRVTHCTAVQRPDMDEIHVSRLPQIIAEGEDERESLESFHNTASKPQIKTSKERLYKEDWKT